QAAAIIELAEATRQKGLAEAEAQRALNDAINVLSDEQTSLRFRLALLDALPAVIEKSTELFHKECPHGIFWFKRGLKMSAEKFRVVIYTNTCEKKVICIPATEDINIAIMP
ncbi:TPA: PilI type IV pilus biogenesis protein, partial [Escherichia coli]